MNLRVWNLWVIIGYQELHCSGRPSSWLVKYLDLNFEVMESEVRPLLLHKELSLSCGDAGVSTIGRPGLL